MKTLVIALSASLLAAALPAPPAAAQNAFLWIPGMPGESIDPDHSGWIEVLAVTNSVTRRATLAPRPARVGSGLVILKRIDKASPLLYAAAGQGQPIQAATLEVASPWDSRLRLFQINLSNVVVQAISATGTSVASEEPSLEWVELTFQKISWVYTAVDPTTYLPLGYVGTSWDLLRGTGTSTNAPAAFTVTGIQKGSGQVQLQWNARSGRNYRIYSSTEVSGPYVLLSQVGAISDGTTSCTVPFMKGSCFFVVEEGR